MNFPKSISVNFKNLRINRQKNNNLSVFNCIKNNNKIEFYKKINEKELLRILEELNFNFEDFWNKCCKDDIFSKLVACHLSKCASRQGTKDEDEQLRICNITAMLCGIEIINLTSTAIRPTKNGTISTKKEMKDHNISKDCCLKSFDGKICGKINGYISAKVSFGSGGHQDNVFEEMDTLAEWWCNYKKNTDEYLIILIDTDLEDKFNCIKLKYEKCHNIKIFNHYDFQEYIILNFYTDELSVDKI